METPMQEFISKLESNGIEILEYEKTRALQKEKKAIKFAFVAGFAHEQNRLTGKSAGKYYNETFNQV